jgi:UPF0271 protein
VKHGVGVGAHGGYPDLLGFGRRYMDVSPQELKDTMVYQMGALSGFARAAGARVEHFKTHGAIDSIASKDPAVAAALAEAVAEVDTGIIFIAPNKGMADAALSAGLRIAREVYADRAYLPDGTLVPRSQPGAVIADEELVVRRVLRMIREGVVTAFDGADLEVAADTVCVHGDTPGAPMFARKIRESLQEHGVIVAPLGRIL